MMGVKNIESALADEERSTKSKCEQNYAETTIPTISSVFDYPSNFEKSNVVSRDESSRNENFAVSEWECSGSVPQSVSNVSTPFNVLSVEALRDRGT